ncbi:mitotic apparatus protein p62-like [Scomber scombrus]|uniref:Mitotic apparatus protein p62-like n=1 Tax=Scomber scombrus TaxID=13677 RepID=A0AAV1P630_SCOSC
MDIYQKKRPCLEPIQEESEQEDETEGDKTGKQEEDFQGQVSMETDEVMAKDESNKDEDDDVPLRVLRPRRLSHSSSHESFPQMQSTNNDQEEMENLAVSDLSTFAEALSDATLPPGKPRIEFQKSFSSTLPRTKVSKIVRQKHKPPQQSVQKKTNRKRNKKASLVDEPFPQWLVDLMVNIEEATTHQLVVE